MILHYLAQALRTSAYQQPGLVQSLTLIGCLASSAACADNLSTISSMADAAEAEGPRDYIVDAIEGAKLAQLRKPEVRARVLFSPVGGGAPVTGGERNMGFLAVAAHHLGFDVYCSTNYRGEGLEWLEGQGVVGVTNDDAYVGQVPNRLGASVVSAFESSMHQWQRHPKSASCRDQVLADFDAIDARAKSGALWADRPSDIASTTELILLRALRLRQVVRYYHIDTVIADTSLQAMASLLACTHSSTQVFIYAQSTSGDSYDEIFAENIHVMAVSNATARRFEGANNVFVVMNGINLRRFAPAANLAHNVRDELGIPASAFVIGNTGYISEIKNQVAVLKAAIAVSKDRPDVHVVFIGYPLSSHYKAELDRIAESSSFASNVHYLGLRQDVDRILKEVDVFIFPSLSEGFGLSLAEAMGTEVPVIASDLDSFHEFVGDTVNLVDLHDDGTQMIAALHHVIHEPDAAKALARRSRKQLIDMGMHTDRMVESFAIMLGARPLSDSIVVQVPSPKAKDMAIEVRVESDHPL